MSIEAESIYSPVPYLSLDRISYNTQAGLSHAVVGVTKAPENPPEYDAFDIISPDVL